MSGVLLISAHDQCYAGAIRDVERRVNSDSRNPPKTKPETYVRRAQFATYAGFRTLARFSTKALAVVDI